jgi:GrpB-like predicted nucleotidyltransferase (UPF0157 family)
VTDQRIEVVPYDPAWPARFEEERRRLEDVLGPWLEGGIHHVGSTAVPGLAAKPVIDILAGVRDREEARAAFESLAALGYCYFPYRADEMHWFCKPSPAFRTHHLHLIEPGNPRFAAELAFRDELRAHPETAAEYAALKLRLAERHRDEREAYTEGKSAFVEAVVTRAVATR